MSIDPEITVARRRRSLTRTEWTEMRPHIERLYIEMDMTLRDVMQRLDEEHNFHAT